MIYLLCWRDDYRDSDDCDDIVELASTNFDDILNYLNEKNTCNYQILHRFEILVLQNNDDSCNFTFPVSESMDRYFDGYHRGDYFWCENIEEFDSNYKKVHEWCLKVKQRREEISAKAIKERQAEDERRERELYEKLKAKYGD